MIPKIQNGNIAIAMHKLIILFLYISTIVVDVSAQAKELASPPETEPSKWGDISEIPVWNELEIFEKISEDHSKNSVKIAREYFTESVEGYRKIKTEIDKERKNFNSDNYPQDRYEWQKKSREEFLNRDLHKKQMEARQQAITVLIKAMQSADQVKNPDILKSTDFLDLKASIYREYSKHQFALKNYQQTIDILEKYIKISESYLSDQEAHKLLAISFGKLQIIYQKRKNEEIAEKLLKKKHFHLLKYTELKYGKDSAQYKRALEETEKENFSSSFES